MRLLFQSRIFVKTLVMIMLVLTTVTFVLSTVLYLNFEKSALETVKKNNSKFLSQLSFSADYMNENAKNFTQSLYTDINTDLLMYQTSTDYVQLIGSMDRINRFIQMNSFVQSVTIYNKKLQRYLSSGSRAFNSPETFFDKEIVSIMEQSGSKPPLRLLPIHRFIDESFNESDDNKNTSVFTYFMYENVSKSDGLDGVVIVNIKGEYLNNLMKSKDLSETGETFVIDQKIQVVSTTQNNSANSSIGAKVVARGDSSGYFLDKVAKQRVMVTYASTNSLGWKFIHVEPYDLVIADIQKIKKITTTIVLCLLLLELFISFIISRRLYSPIRNLVGKMTQLMDINQPDTNEIAFLNNTVSEAYLTMRSTLINRKHEILRNLLLNPEAAVKGIPTLFEKYRISLDPFKSYVLATLRIDHYAGFTSQFSKKDQTLFRFSIGNLANELYWCDFKNEAVDMGNDTIVVILSIHPDTLENAPQKIAEISQQIQLWCAQHLKISITVSIGNAGHHMDEIYLSYQEGTDMANYRLIFGHQSIITPELIIHQSSNQYKISTQEDSLLYEALVNGKLDEAIKIFSDITDIIKQRTYDIIMSNIHYLTYSVYDTLNLMEGNGLERFNVDYSTFIKKIYQLETLDEINELFSDLFVHITDIVRGKKDKRSSVLVDTIMELIQLNYKDKNLSLDSIANKMEMSKVYLGKVFRITCGQSVADYILDIRMEKAMELLKAGETSLEEILDRVGIENQKYFYTLFKKKFGVTFSEYKLKKVKLYKNE
jgi:two-component system response regulator YesN